MSSSIRRPTPKRWRVCAPSFDKDGTVTAGNASGLNDGAAGVVLHDGAECGHSWTSSRSAASRATRLSALDRASWVWTRAGVKEGVAARPAGSRRILDLLEINEAFAAQACAVNNEMAGDTSKVNVNGGAHRNRHPIGASGCRILVTLLHEMIRVVMRRRGSASLCIGGGMGVALGSGTLS